MSRATRTSNIGPPPNNALQRPAGGRIAQSLELRPPAAAERERPLGGPGILRSRSGGD